MDESRRDFLKLLGITVTVAAVAPGLLRPLAAHGPIPPGLMMYGSECYVGANLLATCRDNPIPLIVEKMKFEVEEAIRSDVRIPYSDAEEEVLLPRVPGGAVEVRVKRYAYAQHMKIELIEDV